MARSTAFSLSVEERLTSVEQFMVGFMAQERELQYVAKDVISIKKDLDEMKISLQNVTFMCKVRAEERQLQDTVKYIESIQSEIKTDVEDITSLKARMEEICTRVPGNEVPSNEVPQSTIGEEVSAEIAIAVHGAEAGDGTTTGNRSNEEALHVAPAEQAGEDGGVIKHMLDSIAAERFLALESRVVNLEVQLSGVPRLTQDYGTSLRNVVDSNDQVVKELQMMPKEQMFDAAQTCSAHGNTFNYNVEESIYGLLAMPGIPLRVSICSLLLLLYVLTSGLIGIIYASTVATANIIRSELYAGSDEADPICQMVLQGDSHTWVCSPPVLVNLMDFDKLDSNADGLWSVGEARNAGLLAQFRAIQELALEQYDVLESIFPPVPAVHSPFCTVLLSVAGIASPVYMYLSESDHIQMFFVEQRHSDEEVEAILRQCNLSKDLSQVNNPAVWSKTAPMELGPYLCIMDSLCNPMPIVPGNTSESLFYANTSFMAFMPKSLHKALSLKMLRPCRLLDAELCANAEHQAHSMLSEIWPDLPVDQAVRKCSDWVQNVCPRLLGEEFRAIQARMSDACGDRSYRIFNKTAKTPTPSNIRHVRQCKDPEDGGLAVMETMNQHIFTQQPLLIWAAYGQEAEHNFTRGTLRSDLDCQLGVSEFGFHQSRLEFELDNRRGTLADFFGERCPQSSCVRIHDSYKIMPIGCPAECVDTMDSANHVPDPFNISFGAGSYTQMGHCDRFKTEVDASSGSLKVSRLQEIDPQGNELCEIILRLDKSARVYVITWNLPRRKFVTGDGLCFTDNLEIDGKKYCHDQKPTVINLHPRPVPFKAMIWSTCPLCGEFHFNDVGYDNSQMGFEIIITDASYPTQYPLVTVSFENHLWYWESKTGVQRPTFNGFLILIMLVWIGYLGEELEKCTVYVRYINHQTPLLRKFSLLLVLALPRCLVWTFVLYTGILLLATAHSYIDLVLNSVALSFVLEFDEYLYVMVVPGSLKKQVKDCDPIQLKYRRLAFAGSFGANRAFDVQITVRMMCLVVVAVVVVQALYGVDWLGSPHFTRISEVYDCLCALHGPNCPAY